MSMTDKVARTLANYRAERVGTVFGPLTVIRYDSATNVTVLCECGAESRKHWSALTGTKRGIRCYTTKNCRFANRFSKDEDGCWRWKGAVHRNGYGHLRTGDGERDYAHRFSWSLANDRVVPDGLYVMHSCDHPSCVNPAHLSVGTPADNIQDMVEKGRGNKGIDHHTTNFTEADVLGIRQSPLSRKELALNYDVSYSAIARIINRKTWKHLPPED